MVCRLLDTKPLSKLGPRYRDQPRIFVTDNSPPSPRSIAEAPSSEHNAHYGYQIATWVLAAACIALGLGLVVVAFALRRKNREVSM